MYCKNCNAFVNQGDSFCQNCGARVDVNNNVGDYKDTVYDVSLSQRKSWDNSIKKTLLITTVIVLLVVCLAVIVITRFNGNSNNNTANSFVTIMMLIIAFGVFLILYSLSKKKSKSLNDERFNTYFKTFTDNNTVNYMNQILNGLGYKVVNYKGEHVYFANNVGGFLFGSSAYPRYIKFQVMPDGIKIQAWVVFRKREMGLEGDFGIAIKSRLKEDLNYIYNSIVVK